MDRTLHTQPALARYPLDNPEDILGGIRPFRPRNSVKSVYVSGWSDEEICKVVKQEEGAGLVRNLYSPLRYVTLIAILVRPGEGEAPVLHRRRRPKPYCRYY